MSKIIKFPGRVHGHKERPAQTGADVGVVEAFPVAEAAARLIDVPTMVRALDNMRPAHPNPTDAEKLRTFEHRKAYWLGIIETMRSDLRQRGLPQSAINAIITKYTDDVRAGLVAAREARINPKPVEMPW